MKEWQELLAAAAGYTDAARAAVVAPRAWLEDALRDAEKAGDRLSAAAIKYADAMGIGRKGARA